MFKKIYVEVTNNCNLSCPFCNPIKRNKEYVTIDNFKVLLKKLKPYTKYLYFHVMGEPLMHPNINELIDMASKDFFINITTNGYLIKKILNNHHIRQINISLHSYNPSNGKTLEEYLNDIFLVVDNLKDTYINYRLWDVSNYNEIILKYLSNHYNMELKLENTKINEHTFISVDKEFIWPNLDNEIYLEKGSCLGTISHIGILVNGDIVPCCLDTNGNIKLGNVYQDEFDKNRFDAIKEGFKNNQKKEELCRHCSFYE